MAELNDAILAELDTNPSGEPLWVNLGNAFRSVKQSLNERLSNKKYVGSGFDWNYVSGLDYRAQFTGDYIPDDPAIGYLFSPSVLFGIGEARITNLRITKGNHRVKWQVSLTRISDDGGNAGEPCTVTLELRSLGSPSVEAI